MKIKNLLFTPGASAFFFDDQKAVKSGAELDGFCYRGTPQTPGFTSIRQAGEVISIIIELEDGRFACGDAAAVQYSGAGGRDPLFSAANYLPFLRGELAADFTGREFASFREASEFTDNWRDREGKRLHTAIRYGLSQALLEAQALTCDLTKCEVVRAEYNLAPVNLPVPIFGQTGDERYLNADKMILKRCDALPHGLFNTIPDKLGKHGEKLSGYLLWLTQRIGALAGTENYRPAIHIDVYGTLGTIFDNHPGKIAEYLQALEVSAGIYPLYIEGPVDAGAKDAQIELMRSIRDILKSNGSKVKIVADEWCNTLEDIREFTDAQCCDMVQIKTPDLGAIHNVVESTIYCRENGMEPYQGGTCNESDVSARCCVHLALAARPERILAKPGMGFDEGFCIAKNEMNRTLAIIEHRQNQLNKA